MSGGKICITNILCASSLLKLTHFSCAIDLPLFPSARCVLSCHTHSVGGEWEELLEDDIGLRALCKGLHYAAVTSDWNIGQPVSQHGSFSRCP